MPGGELPTLLPGAGGPDSAAAGAPHSLPVAGLAAMKNLLIGWPQLQELRSAADSNPSSCHDRRRHAATSLAACSRAEMTAALIAQRGRGPGVTLRTEVDAALVVLGGQVRHASLRALHDGGLRVLTASWHLPERDVRVIATALRTVIGPPAVFGASSCLPLDALACPSDVVSDFALAPLLFGESLAAGWPWALALRLFSGLRRGRSCDGGLGFLPERGKHSPPPPGGGWSCGTISSAADPDVMVTVYFNDAGVGYVSCTRAVFGSDKDGRGPVPAWLVRSKSRWLPEYIRFEVDGFGIPLLPKHHVTSLLERRHVWERLIKMDGVARAIVMGKLSYPRTCWRITPSYLPNHKSWEVDAVKAKLGQKMAAYFFQGAAEAILPGHPLPTIIEPKGAVPKKGKDEFRDISDARMGNKTILKWGTRLFPARDLAASLQWRSIMNGFDISDGYHVSLLTGCTGELVLGFGITGVRRVYEGDPEWTHPVVVGADGSSQPAPGPHGPQAVFEYGWRLHVGCWPGNCCQTCDKALCGFFFDGCLARWAVAHFGQAPAGSPLNCIALCLLRHAALRGPAAGQLRGASSRSVHGVVWVDDFVFYHLVAWHAACAGLSGGCPVCLRALANAQANDAWWTELCEMLGVPLNMAKHQTCKQTVEYSGFLFDSFRGLMQCLDEKLALLHAHTAELQSPTALWTPRDLDRIKGRLLHYSTAIRHLRIRVTEMQRCMGPLEADDSDAASGPSPFARTVSAHYDRPAPVPSGLPALAAEMDDLLARYGPLGVPLWPHVASSAYAALLSGEEKSIFCALTWDASPVGWAALGRWWAWSGSSWDLRELLLVGSWPDGWDTSEQPYREALAGALGFEGFAQAVDIQGFSCVLRNDAAAAISCFRKGSTQSPQMQRCALRLDRAAASANVDLLPYHVPGLTLVAEGIDGASRAGADFGAGVNVDSILGPAVSDKLWQLVTNAAAAAGWGGVTVDAFASESNARAPRFWSRFHEPGAEAIDALCVSDWARSACPVCGMAHREVLFLHPPSALVKAAVEKACADRALCVLLVPVAILQPHWGKLLSASVLPRGAPYVDGFHRIRDPDAHVAWPDAQGPAELAIFACDFGRLQPRAGLPSLSSCPGASARRPRPLCGSADDARDRHYLREAMLAQRCGVPRGGDGAGSPCGVGTGGL